MQVIKCSNCRKIAFFYEGDVRVGKIKASQAFLPDGSRPKLGSGISRPCGCGRIYGRIDKTLYIDGETENPTFEVPVSDLPSQDLDLDT